MLEAVLQEHELRVRPGTAVYSGTVAQQLQQWLQQLW